MLSAAWDWYYGTSGGNMLDNAELDEPLPSTGPDVSIQLGKLENGAEITVFSSLKTEPNQITTVDICAKRLKIIRHPNILRYVGFEKTDHASFLITERVIPLRLRQETADANEICSGLNDIASALSFLHKQANITHNSLHIDSIYVSSRGDWKLSGLHFSCPFYEAKMELLKEVSRPHEIIPPEEVKGVLGDQIKYGHCRDVYAFGILLQKFKNEVRFSSQVTQQFIDDLIMEILQEEYSERPTIDGIIETEILSSEYISIVNFLQSITLKNKPEKDKFFEDFIARLKKSCIDTDLIAKRIAPLLLSPLVLAEQPAIDFVIPTLLTPLPMRREVNETGLIEEDIFARCVIPIISDLLTLRILHVRQAVMRNISKFFHLFDKTVLKEVILPEILIGLRDENNDLVQSSLHALADAVPIVGADVIVGPERERIFNFGLPKMNGSILLDASSMATQIKPKRIPKKPQKLKNEPQKPKTLLEMAMTSKIGSTSREKVREKQEVLARNLKDDFYINENERDIVDEILDKKPLSNGTAEMLQSNGHILPPLDDASKPPNGTNYHSDSENEQAETNGVHSAHGSDTDTSSLEPTSGWDFEGDWEDFDESNNKNDILNTNSSVLPKPLSPENVPPIQPITLKSPDQIPQKQPINVDLNLGAEFEVKVERKRQKSIDFFEDILQ